MPDVNLLVYAHRREDPDHTFYRTWLESLANGTEPFALSSLVAVIDSLVAMDSCQLLNPGEKHWEFVRKLCAEVSAHGKQVADAQHAALALEHGCTWVTRDGDFERFRKAGLRLEMIAP